MTQIAILVFVSASVILLPNGSVSDPASWALVLAAVAGGLLGRTKQPIVIEG